MFRCVKCNPLIRFYPVHKAPIVGSCEGQMEIREKKNQHGRSLNLTRRQQSFIIFYSLMVLDSFVLLVFMPVQSIDLQNLSQEILFVSFGNCILRINAKKAGSGKGSSVDNPIKVTINTLNKRIHWVGKHDGEVTDLSMYYWLTTRLASASTDGTVCIHFVIYIFCDVFYFQSNAICLNKCDQTFILS